VTRSAVAIPAALLLVAVVVVGGAAGALGGLLAGDTSDLAPTAQALAGIPPDYLAAYQQAAAGCPGLPWTVLAAIGEVESNHGRSAAPGVRSGANVAGAAGPMQLGIGTGAAGDAFRRFAIDGNRDGIASPYDPADAIPTAAAYLCQALHDHHGDLRSAVLAYNHAGWYADRVLTLAVTYGTPTTAPSQAARTAIDFARAQLGIPYRWGGDGPEEGGFDCSGLTHAAYQAAGISLPRTAQTQYQAGPHLPPGIAVGARRPGVLRDLTPPRHPRRNRHRHRSDDRRAPLGRAGPHRALPAAQLSGRHPPGRLTQPAATTPRHQSKEVGQQR
jgi:NlpC/P60 family/Transglycosylase SLT domain